MGILETPIDIILFDDIYHKALEEYNDKMEEYYDNKDKFADDDVFAKIQANSMEKPIPPEPKKSEGILKIKEELVLGYEIVEDKIYLILDNNRVNTKEHNYYIIKKNDKIIERLDNILENN